MKSAIVIVVLFVLCVVVTVLRFVLPLPGLRPDDIYKDLAHLLVGGLFGAAIVAVALDRCPMSRLEMTLLISALWLMAVGLFLVECIAFGLSLLA